MAKQSLLNEEQTRVNLFLFPIVLDKNLPKYQLMGDKKSEKDEDVAWEFSNSIGETVKPLVQKIWTLQIKYIILILLVYLSIFNSNFKEE